MGIEKKMKPDRSDKAAGSTGPPEQDQKAGKPITVHAYSGFKKDEKPRAFELEGKRLTVLSVRKTWQEESEHGRHRKTFFRVHAHNGRTYDIAIDAGTGEWTLEPELREDK
ncbi:MAG: hypothetical protein HZB44_01890 [Actinobacteria bacterium]|nr:hypothetical protein [Actinomycetota bacterium]